MTLFAITRSETNESDWNDFVDHHPAGWWWHRQEWLDYCLDYDGEARDHSFAVVSLREQRIVALCPAIVKQNAVGMGDDPCAGLLSIDDRSVRDELVRFTVNRLQGFQCSWRWTQFPMSNTEFVMAFTELGFVSSSWRTAIADLTKRNRWKAIRKSYRSLINKAERESNLVTGKSLFPLYRQCHQDTATRPRSAATYSHQEQWVKNGFAQIFIALHKDDPTPLAVSMVIEYKGHAYYASGASIEPNLQHALQWMAMESFGSRGGDSYELGWIDQHGSDDSIGFFKKGFGGDLYSVDAIAGRL